MNVVKEIESCGSMSGRPTKEVRIADCGELDWVTYEPKEGDPENVPIDAEEPVAVEEYATEKPQRGSFQIQVRNGRIELTGDCEGLEIEAVPIGLE